jgi:SAM-dependent methyltransferase
MAWGPRSDRSVVEESPAVSHPEQLAFFRACAATNVALLAGGRLLEVGSYDVNGSVRQIFSDTAEYVGIDLQTGPGVDLVGFGHELDFPDSHFDVAISGECFEHDPHWRETLANMVRVTRPNGFVAFTCASRGRPEHGTRRTDRLESPGTQSAGLDYYRNLVAADFETALPLADWFSSFRFWYLPTSFDLYFAGVRRDPGRAAGVSARLPDPVEVAGLSTIMSTPHRIARLPLRALLAVVPEDHYQNFALPYWRALLALQDKLTAGRFRRAEHQ